MTKKHKILLHIVAVLVIIGLISQIAMLYAEKYQTEKSRKNDFLTMYSISLIRLSDPLGKFDETKTFDDQLSCLEAITDKLRRLSAYMEMHPLSGMAQTEVDTVILRINDGGMIGSYQIESFQADGAISEEETTVIQLFERRNGKITK